MSLILLILHHQDLMPIAMATFHHLVVIYPLVHLEDSIFKISEWVWARCHSRTAFHLSLPLAQLVHGMVAIVELVLFAVVVVNSRVPMLVLVLTIANAVPIMAV